jgi:hypothetical protein
LGYIALRSFLFLQEQIKDIISLDESPVLARRSLHAVSHLHSTGTPDNSADPQISCVCAKCARRAAAQVAPDTGTPAHEHTHGCVYPRGSSRRLPPSVLPPATGVEMAFDPENLPTVPTHSAPLFFQFQSSQAQINEDCGDLRSNISATRGHQDTRFCVCESPRGDLSHIASLTLCCSRSDFFRSHSESSRLQSVGGRTDSKSINRKPSVNIGVLIDSFNICKLRVK